MVSYFCALLNFDDELNFWQGSILSMIAAIQLFAAACGKAASVGYRETNSSSGINKLTWPGRGGSTAIIDVLQTFSLSCVSCFSEEKKK